MAGLKCYSCGTDLKELATRRKCPICGARVSRGQRGHNVSGSCTGVKYPCNTHCKECFFMEEYIR